MTLKVCCLCPFYSIILFWLLSLQKTLPLEDKDVGNGSKLFSAFAAVSGYSVLTLTQNVWTFEIVSNILLRPLSFSSSSGNVNHGERL